MGRHLTSQELELEIGALADLPRADLIERWQELYRCDPPKGLSTQLMIRSMAYEMQAKRFGGLKTATARKLRKFAGAGNGSAEQRSSVMPRTPSPDPGTRLVREWNGVTHTVDVTDDGFTWRGEQYGSLSEIAREITGARWSGPRFFGLNGRETS